MCFPVLSVHRLKKGSQKHTHGLYWRRQSTHSTSWLHERHNNINETLIFPNILAVVLRLTASLCCFVFGCVCVCLSVCSPDKKKIYICWIQDRQLPRRSVSYMLCFLYFLPSLPLYTLFFPLASILLLLCPSSLLPFFSPLPLCCPG